MYQQKLGTSTLGGGHLGTTVEPRRRKLKLVSKIGHFRSDIVTCIFFLSMDLPLEIFICPSAQNIEGGQAASSQERTSSKLVSLELTNIPIGSDHIPFPAVLRFVFSLYPL